MRDAENHNASHNKNRLRIETTLATPAAHTRAVDMAVGTTLGSSTSAMQREAVSLASGPVPLQPTGEDPQLEATSARTPLETDYRA